MKKQFSAILAGILALTLAGCGGSTGDDSLKKIQDAGVINIGLEGDWQPFSYHDENDDLVGYDVEVAKGVAEKLGVEAKITEAPWDGLLTGLSTGVYDIVVNGVDVTEEREKTFDFSDPYAYDHIDLVTLKDNTDITTEWSMRMDADEELLEDLAQEIDEKLGGLQKPVNGVILRRRTIFMGKWIKHGGRYPELLLRIFRTGEARCEMKIMDEHMILSEGIMVTFKHDLMDNNQKDDYYRNKHNRNTVIVYMHQNKYIPVLTPSVLIILSHYLSDTVSYPHQKIHLWQR